MAPPTRNKFNPAILSHRRAAGGAFERLVLKIFESRGYRALLQNARLKGIEIDLLLEQRGTGNILLVEAKFRTNAGRFQGPILSLIQYRRLLRALSQIRRDYPGRQVSWVLAYRNHRGEVEFVANPCYF